MRPITPISRKKRKDKSKKRFDKKKSSPKKEK